MAFKAAVYTVKAANVGAYRKYDQTRNLLSDKAYVLKGGDSFNAHILSGTTDILLISSGPANGMYTRLVDNGSTVNIELKSAEVITTTEAIVDEESSDSVLSSFFMDDSFLSEYSSVKNESEYLSNLELGLRIENLRGVLGMPHQFLPSADPRITGSSIPDSGALGRTYSERIVKNIPLLLITPGIPTFMASFSEEQKRNVLDKLISGANDDTINMLEDNYSGKYYSLKYSYVDYFAYVNAMLRSAAVFLGIQNKVINGHKLGSFNWLYDASSDAFGNSGINRFLGPYAGCIALYADAGSTVDDSFSNSTTTSQLVAGTMNSLSDQGRELNFLLGNVGSIAGLKLTALTGSENLEENMQNMQDVVDSALGGGNIFSNILNKAQTILAGGRLVFPEIWSDSSFGRSYSCRMRLVSPSGDKLSVYLNILVPIYHLLGMCLPRQSIQQSYFSPFLLRCYYKGLFNVDMGIMTGLSITKGADAEWTIDGLPTVAEVNFEIKDLYEGMFMSKAEFDKDMTILSNITELDYIANSCGININDQEVMRTVKLWKALYLDSPIKDFVANGIVGNIAQYFNNKLNSLFGVF